MTIGTPPRPGFGTVTPYLVVADLNITIRFLERAFGATEHFRTTVEGGGTHLELRIGDSMLMIGAGPEDAPMEPRPAMLFLYVEDVDVVFASALEAGATVIMPPTDGAFGEPRGGGVEDPAGNQWFMATWRERPGAPPGFDG